MNGLGKRTLSGSLFVIVLTGCIFLHPIAFFVLFLIVNILGLFEFAGMGKKMDVYVHTPLYILCGCSLFSAGFLFNYIGGFPYQYFYLPFFVLLVLIPIGELYRKKGNSFKNLAFTYYGIFYISLPLTLLVYIPYHLKGAWSPEIVFLPFLLVWVNDTFAYLFGITLGRHKLFYRISPKKSWEGAIGGGVMTMAVMYVLLATCLKDLSYINGIIIALLVVIFSIFGDLIESLMKRNVNIKDSGDIIPGHGGILDRFDAVLFVIPATFIYLEFIG